jgi:hypothetical protein
MSAQREGSVTDWEGTNTWKVKIRKEQTLAKTEGTKTWKVKIRFLQNAWHQSWTINMRLEVTFT